VHNYLHWEASGAFAGGAVVAVQYERRATAKMDLNNSNPRLVLRLRTTDGENR
jgi:hypothetical protein